MPRFDGTGPRGAGMFTGRGEGYCVLRLPAEGSEVEQAVGYAGLQGRPVQLPDTARPLGLESTAEDSTANVGTPRPAGWVNQPYERGRRCRRGRRGRHNALQHEQEA